jgi:hypothetical protein
MPVLARSKTVFRLDNIDSLEGFFDVEDLLFTGFQDACADHYLRSTVRVTVHPGNWMAWSVPSAWYFSWTRAVMAGLIAKAGCSTRVCMEFAPRLGPDNWPALAADSCTLAQFDWWLRPANDQPTLVISAGMDTSFSLVVIMKPSNR